MNDIRDVAALIVQYCKSEGYELDTIKLQALLYYIQWVYLKDGESPCFDEDPIAGSVGPIFPTVLKEYETYTSSDYAHERSCHCPQNVRKTWAVEKNVGRMQKWQTYVVCRPA